MAAPDALDQLATVAGDLLAKVDDMLGTVGAPEDHPVWPLLRSVGALPGQVVTGVSELRPASLAGAGPVLRALSEQVAEMSVVRPAGLGWRGMAADAFTARWAALSTYLAGSLDEQPSEESFAGRLVTTAHYTEAVADWAGQTRLALARALAEVLTSAQAVTIITGEAATHRTGHPVSGRTTHAATGEAAADIAAHLLGCVAGAYELAHDLLGPWAARLGELLPPRTEETGPAGQSVIVPT